MCLSVGEISSAVLRWTLLGFVRCRQRRQSRRRKECALSGTHYRRDGVQQIHSSLSHCQQRSWRRYLSIAILSKQRWAASRCVRWAKNPPNKQLTHKYFKFINFPPFRACTARYVRGVVVVVHSDSYSVECEHRATTLKNDTRTKTLPPRPFTAFAWKGYFHVCAPLPTLRSLLMGGSSGEIKLGTLHDILRRKRSSNIAPMGYIFVFLYVTHLWKLW